MEANGRAGRRAQGARSAVFTQLAEGSKAEQVAQRLTDAIVMGVLASGERLPSEADLAKRFGVAVVTAREGLQALRDAGLVQTKRGRGGGSFVNAAEITRTSLLEARLRGMANVDISDLAIYFATVAAGCVEQAAERCAPQDSERLSRWLSTADFTPGAPARRNASGFYLEVAVLSQSPRLVREQIRLQAEFGPLLWLGMGQAELRTEIVAGMEAVAAAVGRQDAAAARALVRAQTRLITRWLLAAKASIGRGGNLHD